MSRLARFEHYRFIGDRRTMKVYDCDDPADFDVIGAEIKAHDLVRKTQLQSFAPDTLDEARNRGFRPA